MLVGISHYNTAETGWKEIHGAEDVRMLTPILEKEGFSIDTLTEANATYSNIVKSIKHLIQRTQNGDIVYLHFSTHGQPFKDVDHDEIDGWDESLIPFDASMFYEKDVYEGNAHLLDDEISVYLKNLRENAGKKGMVYVVMDACHAGSISRAEEDVPYRGSKYGFSFDGESYKPKVLENYSHYQLETEPTLSGILILEACKPFQRNVEININGQYFGSLSYYVSQAIKGKGLNRKHIPFLEQVKKGMSNLEGQELVYEHGE